MFEHTKGIVKALVIAVVAIFGLSLIIPQQIALQHEIVINLHQDSVFNFLEDGTNMQSYFPNLKGLVIEDKGDGDYIFKGQLSHLSRKPITTQQYARIVKRWLKKLLGIEDVSQYSTHSLRKTKPSVIYEKTHNVDAVRRLLGQSSCHATNEYLGVTDNASLDLARTINI